MWDPASVEPRVREIIAQTTGSPAGGAPLLGAPFDSLTLLAIVTRIEAAFDIALDIDETAALLGARTVTELAALITRKVAERRANLDETAGNESCVRGENAP